MPLPRLSYIYWLTHLKYWSELYIYIVIITLKIYNIKLPKRRIFSESIIKKLLQIIFSWTLKYYYWIASLRKLRIFLKFTKAPNLFFYWYLITLINFKITVAQKCHGKTKQPWQNKKDTAKQKPRLHKKATAK